MAKFKVLRPIEVGGILYVPDPDIGVTPAAKAKSCANGADVPVDSTGVIDLTNEQAAQMRDGQIAALPAPTKKAKDKP